jgi:hypothetical protein
MKEGFVKCPLCGRPVGLIRHTGQMTEHYSSLGKPGSGFRSLAQQCRGSYKKPEGLK